jgi:hypothetical protein
MKGGKSMPWLKAAIILAGAIVAVVVFWLGVKPMIEPAHTVSYYVDHPDERAAEIARGNNSPAARGPNYQAAWEAKLKVDASSFLSAAGKHE